MLKFILATLMLLITLPAYGQSGGSWKRRVSVDRSTRERTTAISTLSTNLVTFFGRKGRAELEIQTYLSTPGLVVHTFAKTVPGQFPTVNCWLDNEPIDKEGVWRRSEDSNTTLVFLASNEMISKMLKAKTLSVEFKGNDDENHKATFNIQGLAAHLNFLELKIKK